VGRTRESERDTLGEMSPLVFIVLWAYLFSYSSYCSSAVDPLLLPARGANATNSGILLCAADFMADRLMSMITQIRFVWSSSAGIAVAHCDELESDTIDLLLKKDPGIQLINVCRNPAKELGIDAKFAKKKLRGFFCKIAGTILSPFEHTMLADLDVTFFKSPEYFFELPQYRAKGALFFRDRVYPSHVAPRAHLNFLRDKFDQYIPDINTTTAKQLSRESGVNFFWNYVAANEPMILENVQDSSIVLLHRPSHPRTIDFLKEALQYEYGYGDKEMFWIAATLAKEGFLFEPFDAGMLTLI
jgi:hypothetical protein